MGGGPATIYGAQAFEALEQFETQGDVKELRCPTTRQNDLCVETPR